MSLPKTFNKNWPLEKQMRWYLERQPRARCIPGFFNDKDELVRGPFWLGELGGKLVGDTRSGDNNHIDGHYFYRSAAIAAAKRFQDKTRVWVEEHAKGKTQEEITEAIKERFKEAK